MLTYNLLIVYKDTKDDIHNTNERGKVDILSDVSTIIADMEINLMAAGFELILFNMTLHP